MRALTGLSCSQIGKAGAVGALGAVGLTGNSGVSASTASASTSGSLGFGDFLGVALRDLEVAVFGTGVGTGLACCLLLTLGRALAVGGLAASGGAALTALTGTLDAVTR